MFGGSNAYSPGVWMSRVLFLLIFLGGKVPSSGGNSASSRDLFGMVNENVTRTQRLSDLQPGDKKITLNHLVVSFPGYVVFLWV